jgi:catechol 2,3-dioxygenase-like lactoylglutathione lyase family enzyme
MKRVHIAIGVADFDASVADYTGRLEAVPVVVVPGEYALWRTDILNLSIRMVAKSRSSIAIRHIGIEDDSAPGFSASVDVNGIEWEMFSPEAQMAEILGLWPDAEVIKLDRR